MDKISKDSDFIKFMFLICTFGYLMAIKPSEPYLTQYLMGPHQNLTESELLNGLYPTFIYTNLILLIPIFLLTDFTRYKPVIVLYVLGYMGCLLILIFGNGFKLMILMQILFALGTSGEVSYFSYPYSLLNSKYFHKCTSYMRFVTCFGSFTGSLLAQCLVSFLDIDLYYLNIISLSTCSCSLVLSYFFKMPKSSLLYEEVALKDEDIEIKQEDTETTQVNRKKSYKQIIKECWEDTIKCFGDSNIKKWSFCWIFMMTGWYLIINFIQNLWENIDEKYQMYNGLVESIATILAACSALLVGYIKSEWLHWKDFSFASCSFIKFGLVYVMSTTTNIFVCYSCYCVYIFIYSFVITITQFQLASGLSSKRHALLFGANTFIALVLTTLATILLLEKSVLNLDAKSFYLIISFYYSVLGVIFTIIGIYNCCRSKTTVSI